MKTTINTIISDVKIVIDEITQSATEFLGEEDSVNLSRIIKSFISEAYDYCHLSADLSLMEGDNTTISTCETDVDTKTGYFVVNNMLRFIYVSHPKWAKRMLTELTMFGTPEFDMAFDEYVGANKEHPVASYTFDTTDRRITVMPLPQGKAKLCYITRYTTPSSDSTEFNVDAAIYHPFINYLAALVLLQQNDNRGENLLTLARNEMGINPSNNE